MKLTEYLAPHNIKHCIEVSSKKRALEIIGKIVAEDLNQQYDGEICAIECFSNLFKREKLGSTGINQGVALPHAKLPSTPQFTLDKPIAVFLHLESPIEYESNDHKEVDLIYAVLFPEKCCVDCKSDLPEIAQKLSDKSLQKKLRAAESADDLWHILLQADSTE